MSHQEIEDVPRSRKCTVCLKNNIYVTSKDTIYCTPHHEMQKVRHIRIFRINALSGNDIYAWRIMYKPHQKIRCIVCHIRKYKMYVTSGNTGNAMHVWGTIYTLHQEIQYIVRHIRKYKKYVTPGNIGCTLRPRLRQGFIQHKITYESFTSGLHCKTIRTYWTNMDLA